jgi:hypothetical protein
VVQAGNLFLHLFFSHFYVSPCRLRLCFALYIIKRSILIYPVQ